MKINVKLNYQLDIYEEGFEDLKEKGFEDCNRELIGEIIGETIGQDSALEIINSLKELHEEATIQLIENGKVVSEKKVKIF